MTARPITTGELAAFLGCPLDGPDDRILTGVETIEAADSDKLTFLANPVYKKYIPHCRAGAIIIANGIPVPDGVARLVSPDPYRDFRLAVERLYPTRIGEVKPGIHPLAVVDSAAVLGDGVAIAPFVQVSAGAVIGSGTTIHSGAFIGTSARVGKDCIIGVNVSIRHEILIGDRVFIGDGSIIGYDGFGYTPSPDGYTQIPPVGTVIIEDDVHIGANCCVDRATVGATCIGRGTKLDNLIQVAHGVKIGEHTVIAAQTGISGSTKIGSWVRMGGQVGLVGHIEIGDNMAVGAQAGVTKSWDIKGYISGYPARPDREQKLVEAAQRRLPELMERVKKLEETIRRLSGGTSDDRG